MKVYIFLLLVVLATLLGVHVKTIEGIISGDISTKTAEPDISTKTDESDISTKTNDLLTTLKEDIKGIKKLSCATELDSECQENVINGIQTNADSILTTITDVNNEINTSKTMLNKKIEVIGEKLAGINTNIDNPSGLKKIEEKVDIARDLHRKAKQSYENMASLYSCKQNEVDNAKCQGDVDEAEEKVMTKLKELLNNRCELENAGVDPEKSDVDPDTMKELLKFFSNAKCRSGTDKAYSAAIEASKKHEEYMGSGDINNDSNPLLQKLMEGHRELGSTISGVEEMMNARYVADGGKCKCGNTIQRSDYEVMIDPKKTEYCTVNERKTDTTSYECSPLIPHEDKKNEPNTYRICYNCEKYPVKVFNDSKTQSFINSMEKRNRAIAGGFGMGNRGIPGVNGQYGTSNGTPFNTYTYKSLIDTYDQGPPGYSQTMDLNNNPS
jgi:hypothetical protein